jgi:SAM-dependent methyltransferase
MSLGRHDPFGDVSDWDDVTRWVTQLDERAASPDQKWLRAEVLALAELTSGETVVEVGCGTGPLLRELARAVAPGGRAIGIEPQPVLAAAARERARVEVIEAVGKQLPLESGTADVALAQTVLIHLPIETARGTLAEMARVVRPGGRVLALEQDCDTWTIDHPDRELTRRSGRSSRSIRSQLVSVHARGADRGRRGRSGGADGDKRRTPGSSSCGSVPLRAVSSRRSTTSSAAASGA